MDTSNEGVKLLSLVIYKWDATTPIQLAATLDLSVSPFLFRSPLKEHILFGSRLIASRTPIGGKQVIEIEMQLGRCHVYVHPSGLCATAVTSPAYPMRVAFGFVTAAIQAFQEAYAGQWENITEDQPIGTLFAAQGKKMLAMYQNPAEADKILKVQKDLDEVKDVMLKNIDDLLVRGEKLDELMKKSENLSTSAYEMYRKAKKTNQCCKLY